MNIIEYLSKPQPWLNTEDYQLYQVIIFFIGSLFWLMCYLITIDGIRKHKIHKIPIAAILLNYGWEIGTCLFFVPDMGKLLVIAYWGWMIFDTYIFITLFKYGHKQMQIDYFIRNSHFFVISGLIISFVTQSLFIVQYDLPMAPLSGYIINLVMSIAFLYLYILPDKLFASKGVAWTKFLGTGFISVMFYTKYPHDYFLISMYLAVAFFDIFYLILLHKPQPQTRKQPI